MADKNTIRLFLEKYPEVLSSTIQTFDDNAQRKDPTLSKIIPFQKGRVAECEELQKKGAGIYFSVNNMNRGRRTKDDVTKIKARVCEVDDFSKEKQMDLYVDAPIPPSCIIESNKSYHAYWFAKDGTKENYSTIAGGLRDHFMGDVKLVTDYARVLRIPGFYHLKNENEPFLVDMIYCRPENKYTEEEMMEAYPRRKKEEKSNNTYTFDGGIWDIMASRDNKGMLSDISGTGIVNGEHVEFKKNTNGTEQIRINNKSTSCRIDNQGYIGSSDKGGPTRIQWVMYYGNVTKSELLRWTTDKYKHLLPDDVVNKEKAKEKVREQQLKEKVPENFKHIAYGEKLERSLNELTHTNPREVIKWGREEFDDSLGGIYTGKIYLIGAETGGGKTTFVNLVCENIVKQGHDVVRYSLEDRPEDKGKEEIFFEINRLRQRDNKRRYNWVDFLNNEYGHVNGKKFDEDFARYAREAVNNLSKLGFTELEKHKQVNISELEVLIKEASAEGKRFFVIDHLHYFEMTNNERRDLEIQSVMQRLNDMVRNYNIAVFLVAHYNSKGRPGDKPHPGLFKDGAAIKQVANIIIQIVSDRETGGTEFHITKLRGPFKVFDQNIIYGKFDVETFTYFFTKTPEQVDHEAKFLNSLS